MAALKPFSYCIVAIAMLTSMAVAQQPIIQPAPGNAPTAAQAVNPTPQVVSPQTAASQIGTGSYLDQGNCSTGCDTVCNSFNGLFGRGFIKQSDHCFDDFISPMTNPVFFEDPRALTEARAIYARHKVPLAAGGGDVQLFALQLRARLSENVSLIATKDGYIQSSNPIIGDGWADLAAGLKFNLLRDPQSQTLLSSGFTFELPTGEASAFQGNGNGVLNLFLTGGKKIGCRSHWISAAGLRVPMNATDESMSSYWSNHFDVQVRRGFYLFTELNWYHWLQAGVDGPLPGIEGLDLFNFGNPGVAGNDIVTSAVGAKLKPSRNQEIGFAFEFPVTEREDIIDNRITVDWIVRF